MMINRGDDRLDDDHDDKDGYDDDDDDADTRTVRGTGCWQASGAWL